MNKTGMLLLKLRRECGLTQKALAEKLNVSDKAVSKWECGQGMPDISLLNALSAFFKVSVDNLLSGELDENDNNRGNMKRTKFFVCPQCGNILTSSGNAEISCCGRRLEALEVQPNDEEHSVNIETVEDDFYITFDHEMSKSHYIGFVAYVAGDRILLVKLYPEQGGEVRFARMHGGKLYMYCTTHGLRCVK